MRIKGWHFVMLAVGLYLLTTAFLYYPHSLSGALRLEECESITVWVSAWGYVKNQETVTTEKFEFTRGDGEFAEIMRAMEGYKYRRFLGRHDVIMGVGHGKSLTAVSLAVDNGGTLFLSGGPDANVTVNGRVGRITKQSASSLASDIKKICGMEWQIN